MARPLEPGIPALYNYQSVRYHHIGVAPGANVVLTSEPWSYVFAWLTQRLTKYRKEKRAAFHRAVYYAGLAESFYRAARVSDLPAKSTLVYYGMLNLVKSFISVRGVQLEQDYEHHGLTTPLGTQRVIQVGPAKNGVSIFAEFAKLMGTPVTVQQNLSLSDICLQIPEIHEMSHDVGLSGSRRRYFLPVEIDILVNEQKTKVFSELRYEKKQEVRVDTSRVLAGKRGSYFKDAGTHNGWIHLRSRSRKTLGQGKKSWPPLYRNLLREYEPFDIAALLTRHGYRYYLNLRPGAFHHLCFALALMFYLGSAARYRPTETQALLDSEFRPVVGEAVAILPSQFLYQLVSRITETVCVIPMAKLE